LEKQANPFAEGLAAAERGDFVRAEAIARSLLAHDPNDVHGLQIVGYAAFQQGDNARALDAYLRANRAAPGQPALLYWIGVLFKERGDLVQAERAFRNATTLNPKYSEAWCQLGETLYLIDRKEDAAAAYEAALSAEPESIVVLAKCARFFETIHEMDRAQTLAEKAYTLNPQFELSAVALAEILLRMNEADRAIEILSPLISTTSVNLRNQAKILSLIANAFDRKKKYAESFAALDESHRLQKKTTDSRVAAQLSPLQNDVLEKTTKFLAGANFEDWTRHENLDGAAPVFLVGFVRSGTTWIDQILSSHPKISVMEEEDNFIDIWPKYIVDDEGYNRLPALSQDEINALRASYWRRAKRILKDDKGGLIVDKVPLNTVQLGLIHRIFPESKIIFAVRDPRDCILSAYQQHFQINAGMAHFLDIKSAAEFYDRVMTIGNIIRTRTPIDTHEVRYERLVADFDHEVRAILDFLGLEWDDGVREYAQTAKKRAVRTPSRQQVIQKPYSSSIGKWRNYRDGLAPVLPILATWVEKFGYDPD